MLAELWPLQDRPAILRNPRKVNKMSMDTIQSYFRMQLDQRQAEGGDMTYMEAPQDAAHPSVPYDAQEDNCMDVLHPARWNR